MCHWKNKMTLDWPGKWVWISKKCMNSNFLYRFFLLYKKTAPAYVHRTIWECPAITSLIRMLKHHSICNKKREDIPILNAIKSPSPISKVKPKLNKQTNARCKWFVCVCGCGCVCVCHAIRTLCSARRAVNAVKDCKYTSSKWFEWCVCVCVRLCICVVSLWCGGYLFV